MTSLSTANLALLPESLAQPGYDRAAVSVGIAHFGVGNFHRTHEAVFVDRCLHLPGNEGWGIVGIGISDSPAAREKAAHFERQNCLYTVTEFAPDGSSASRVIGAMVSYLHAPTDPEAVLVQLSDPGLRIVSLTITEGGYNLDETGRFQTENPAVRSDIDGGPPQTVFGFIVRALARRREAGIPAFTVISCDNVRHNGETARAAILGFANEIDADLAEWIADTVDFPNGMVDRIAPYVTSEDKDRLNALTGLTAAGLTDAVPAMSESYLQWVLQDDFTAGRPEFQTVGVELRSDVELFEAVKGRMLNASHVLMSYPALLIGHRQVDEAMADERIRGLLDDFMEIDSIPLLNGPVGVDLTDYKTLILDRFANPAVGDQLIRIATDGATKIPVFHAATIAMLVRRGEFVREAFLLACYAQYLEGKDDQGNAIEVTEPSLTEGDRLTLAAADGLGVLRLPGLAPLALDGVESFANLYLQLRQSLANIGAGRTIDALRSIR